MVITKPVPVESTTCCIVGCGPAGAMLGLLLARSGVDVIVLEKHADFYRDFRGDTIHASTLQVLEELDLLSDFDRLPQQKTTTIGFMTDTGVVTMGDFSSLPGNFQYVSMVPQWDFLTFLTTTASRYPGFDLRQKAEVIALLEENGDVRGVRYRTPEGLREVRARLTVACDGRSSTVRQDARMTAVEFGSPMDVLWYRVPKSASDPTGTFARLAPGRLLPMIDRGTYWQGAYTMPKGSYDRLKSAGISAFQADLRRALPFLGNRIDGIASWDDVGYLEVRVNRLKRWHRPGLLCIGDAAHAMSPVGGVGINLAIQDAVATANLLTEPLLNGHVRESDLAAVQRRRGLPTRLTQLMQLLMQRNLISPLLENTESATLPRPMRIAMRLSVLGRGISRVIGIGFRNEHVLTRPTAQRQTA